MRWARGAAAVAVAVGIAAFGAWLLGWSSNLDPVEAVMGRPATVTVPDLSRLARPRALADVEAAGLRPEATTAFSLTAPRGAVVSQDPPPGSRVDEGSTVTVVVSRGLSRVEMPGAVGRAFDEVVVPLDDAGVDYVVERVASETVAEGVVIEQSPGPGRRVTPADAIRFVVSTGPAPRPVPDVVGLSAEGAAFALGRAGFAVGEGELRDDAAVVPGAVSTTDPVAGTVLPRDAAVDIIVSAGPPPVAVPELVGRSQEAAVASLEAVGLVPNVAGGGPTGGRVASQDPAAGQSRRPGALVNVEVTNG